MVGMGSPPIKIIFLNMNLGNVKKKTYHSFGSLEVAWSQHRSVPDGNAQSLFFSEILSPERMECPVASPHESLRAQWSVKLLTVTV